MYNFSLLFLFVSFLHHSTAGDLVVVLLWWKRSVTLEAKGAQELSVRALHRGSEGGKQFWCWQTYFSCNTKMARLKGKVRTKTSSISTGRGSSAPHNSNSTTLRTLFGDEVNNYGAFTCQGRPACPRRRTGRRCRRRRTASWRERRGPRRTRRWRRSTRSHTRPALLALDLKGRININYDSRFVVWLTIKCS